MMQNILITSSHLNKNVIIKKFKVSLTFFNLILSLWLSLGLNFRFYQTISELTPYHGIKHGLFIASSIVLVASLYHFIFQCVHWRFSAKPLAIIWIIVGGFSAYFVNRLGIVISPDQIQNMLQTDQHEVLDLISTDLVIWSIVIVGLPLFLLFKTQIKEISIQSLLLSKLTQIGLSLLLIGVISYSYYIDYAAIFREHRELKGYLSPQNAFGSSWSYYRAHRPKKNQPLLPYGEDAHLVQRTATHVKPQLVVLVVGETARAESFSLNGYQRPTNPQLSQQDIINFTAVSSCGTATAVSVPCMFSGMTRKNYQEEIAHHRENLLDIAQRAGYQVTWIDNNSGCKEVCNRVEQYVIPDSIKQKWCHAKGECDDEILIDSLRQYIQQIPNHDTRPRLIVLHQMGSHGPAYYKRSTAAYKPFQPECDNSNIQGCTTQQLINSYDNSIVYTDHVLSGLIDSIKSVPKFSTALWYLSDHGESTGENGLYLHGAPYAIAPSQQTHIPMLIWFSHTWKNNHPNDEKCLNRAKNQSISQDNLFPTLLHLLGVQTKTIDGSLDLFTPCSTTSTLSQI